MPSPLTLYLADYLQLHPHVTSPPRPPNTRHPLPQGCRHQSPKGFRALGSTPSHPCHPFLEWSFHLLAPALDCELHESSRHVFRAYSSLSPPSFFPHTPRPRASYSTELTCHPHPNGACVGAGTSLQALYFGNQSSRLCSGCIWWEI